MSFGPNQPPIKVELAEVDRPTFGFAIKGYDALIGLGFVNGTHNRVEGNFMDFLEQSFETQAASNDSSMLNASRANATFERVIAFNLKEPSITFGSIDESAIRGNITFLPLSARSRNWSVDVRNVTVNQLRVLNRLRATFTTITNLIQMSATAAHRLNFYLGARRFTREMYAVPCWQAATMPNVTIAFANSNRVFTLTPEDYVMPISLDLCRTAFGVGAPNGVMKLGGGFMKKFYTILDADKQQVGLGEAV